MSYRQGVIAILHRNGSYILIRKPDRPRDEWYFPAGGREDGEPPIETFYREINEELGLGRGDVKKVTHTDVRHRYEWGEKFIEKTGHQGQEQHLIIAELSEDANVRVEDDEIESFKFVPAEEVRSTLPFDDLKETWGQLIEAKAIPEL